MMSLSKPFSSRHPLQTSSPLGPALAARSARAGARIPSRARNSLPHRPRGAVPLVSGHHHGYDAIMDSTTLRTVADLARKRAERGCSGANSDGLMRLGARRALNRLAADLEASAADLEASAAEFERRPASRRSSA